VHNAIKPQVLESSVIIVDLDWKSTALSAEQNVQLAHTFVVNVAQKSDDLGILVPMNSKYTCVRC
jgi:hypothetical protein